MTSLPVIPAAVVLGIDPGRHIGLAWIDDAGRALHLQVVMEDALDTLEVPASLRVALGDGTGARRLRRRLEARGIALELVNERHSSEEARRHYWSAHPPQGWQRWLPVGLRPPPANLDAYAAWVIALRALQQRGHRERWPRCSVRDN